MKYFYQYAEKKIGKEYVGKHFVAITDPGSGLEKMAKNLNFRKVFLNDPNIGGRYSGLSLFGIVPAALIGIDIVEILNFAEEMSKNNGKGSNSDFDNNTSAVLGSLIGDYAVRGKDKLTFYISEELKDLGGWLEQLIAESTGKDGKGILPVDLEEVVDADYYSKDRLFVIIRLSGDNSFNDKIEHLKENDFPLFEIVLNDITELGGEMFRWEMTTIIASHLMDVQPFDQPNVESAKVVARAMVKEYTENGVLPQTDYSLIDNNISLLGESSSTNIIEALMSSFLK